MIKNFILLSASFITLFSFAQTADTIKQAPKKWENGGIVNINFSQSSFTNWAAGGENSLSGTSLLSLFSKYKKGDNTWDNTLDLAYGMVQSGTSGFRKNEDKIDFSSKYGRYAFKKYWYYSVLINFKSQFANGYNYPNDSVVISRFMSPGYLIGALGLDYKPNDYLSLFVSPLTSKTTFVNDQHLADIGAYGVNPAIYDTVGGKYTIVKNGETVLNQFGGYIKFVFKKDVMKNVNFSTKLELFSNYLKNPQNIQVAWENIFVMKVNKLINASISTLLIYDHNIPIPVEREVNGVKVIGTGPRLQFKEVLAIGISYKF